MDLDGCARSVSRFERGTKQTEKLLKTEEFADTAPHDDARYRRGKTTGV
jgi:hypothetical protein